MSRQKKDFKALNCKLELVVWNALDQHCKKTGVSKTFVAEKAIEKYLDSYNNQQEILKQFDKRK